MTEKYCNRDCIHFESDYHWYGNEEWEEVNCELGHSEIHNMMTAKRYKIKPQDDLFAVVDNYSADKVCIINGIRTEIEAKWLCKDMNTLNDENEQLKSTIAQLIEQNRKNKELLLSDIRILEKAL